MKIYKYNHAYLEEKAAQLFEDEVRATLDTKPDDLQGAIQQYDSDVRFGISKYQHLSDYITNWKNRSPEQMSAWFGEESIRATRRFRQWAEENKGSMQPSNTKNWVQLNGTLALKIGYLGSHTQIDVNGYKYRSDWACPDDADH